MTTALTRVSRDVPAMLQADHMWGGVADPVLDPVTGAPGAGAAPSTRSG